MVREPAKYRTAILKWWAVAILHLALCPLLSAQYGQQWIQYDQQYWRFDITTSGIHVIDYATLEAAGFPVSSVDPRSIQIIGREKEIHIRVIGEEDGIFHAQDEIWVYGLANDGWLDVYLYDSPEEQNNKYHSLINDTAGYFLTYNSSIDNLRMDVFDYQNFDDYPELEYCISRSRGSYTNEYLQGKQDANGVSLPWYETGEGWFDNRFSKGQSVTKSIPTTHVSTADGVPDATVQTISASASSAAGFPNHHLQLGIGSPFQLQVDTVFHGYQLNTLQFTVPASSLSSTTSITHRSIDDLGVATDYNAVSLIEIAYPHNLDFSDAISQTCTFYAPSGQTVATLPMTVAGNAPHLFIAQPTYTAQVEIFQVGNQYKAAVPFVFGLSAENLFLTDATQFQSVTELQPVNSSGYFTDFENVAMDSAFIILSADPLWSAATNYAFYRENTGYNVVMVHADELYDQYGGGIKKHPLAIRRFCDHILSTWESKPSHLFIIGKSIHEMDISLSEGARNNPEHYARNIVPTWGWPASDLAFTSGLNGTVLEAAIPTGRLAAETPEQVLEYLNKVIEHENQQPAEWMKRVMHFGGGGNQYEQTLFSNYLRDYETTVEDTCFGGIVHAFYKNTTDPIQINLSDSITQLIENGVVLMTFFGHASSTGFDQNIDSPSSYNNQGKYPLLIGNSCYTGNIHLPSSSSTSEEFVLIAERGMIGFIAKADLGAPSNLDKWTDGFYTSIFQEHYGETVGEAMVHAVQSFQLDGSNLYNQNTALTFALHGDPAMTLYPHSKPDYVVHDASVFFDPKEVTAQLDSFDVRVAVTNIGKGVNRSFGVELIRHTPNGIDTSLTRTVESLLFSDTLVFTLPVDRVNGVGLNTFDVFVDYPAILVDELDNIGNNIVQNKTLLITSGDLLPVWPYEYAVIPQNQVTLKASTGFVFEPEKEYVFQIDTTDTFNSGSMMEHHVVSGGGVVTWDLPLVLSDSAVYFWRTSADSTGAEGYNWRESSFQYIDGQSGWGQAHFFQFKRDRFKRVDYNREERRLEYTTNDLELKCSVYGSPEDTYEALATRYQIDLEVMDYACCAQAPSLIVAVLDSITLEPWETNYNGLHPENEFGNLMDCSNSRGRPEKYFIFRQNQSADLEGFVDMMQNQVEDGHYVLIYTWKYLDYDGWETHAPQVFDVFTDLGATLVGSSTDSIPAIFFVKKGDPETVMEVLGSDPSDFIEIEAPLQGVLGIGEVQSVEIGPAAQWDAVYWKLHDLDAEPTDSTRIRIIGIQQGAETELADLYQEPDEYLALEDLADAEIYPTLRLEAYLEDISSQTPAQLRSWHVLHDKVPEAALNPIHGFFLSNDHVAEGEALRFAISIDNISDVGMDSVLVKYWIEDEAQHGHPVSYARQAPLPAGGLLLDTLDISTYGLAGNNLLWVEVNPLNTAGTGYDQPEQYHFNNIAQLGFTVQADNQNPILDVTFDGIRILDGDLVSARPHVVISLDDENPFFLLNESTDTAFVKMYLTTPEVVQKPVYFGQLEVNWIPAGSDNTMLIEYDPQFTLDGEYELLVQASDKSGNASGDLDFRIGFEVFSKPTITEVMNYPNPFSTRTQFVFTLTGTTPPDQMMIQIMTISGRVVREIYADELGPLHIGRNFTEYWWDGRDQFGDPLANGIYLYRVVARLNGSDVELRPTDASQYFKEGFGKMYLLR